MRQPEMSADTAKGPHAEEEGKRTPAENPISPENLPQSLPRGGGSPPGPPEAREEASPLCWGLPSGSRDSVTRPPRQVQSGNGEESTFPKASSPFRANACAAPRPHLSLLSGCPASSFLSSVGRGAESLNAGSCWVLSLPRTLIQDNSTRPRAGGRPVAEGAWPCSPAGARPAGSFRDVAFISPSIRLQSADFGNLRGFWGCHRVQ